MNFFLDNNIVQFEGKKYRMTPVEYKGETLSAAVIRRKLMSFVLFSSQNKITIVCLFGSKRIRDLFETKLNYTIRPKRKAPPLLQGASINLNNSNYHNHIVRVEPFLVELEYIV